MLGTPTTGRKTARREETRAEILEAAWEVCRERGLAALTMRELAKRVGMRAPSLYEYFSSKHAIYDDMYAQGFSEFRDRLERLGRSQQPRRVLASAFRWFFDFSLEDPARFQLMFQRTIPGFEPSRRSYAIALEALGMARDLLAGLGITTRSALDMFTALANGLVGQQVANDPGGDRWRRLIGDAVDMYWQQFEPDMEGKQRKRRRQ